MSDDRLSGIEMTLGVLVSGQARIETRLDGLETRLDKVEIAQEQTADHVKQIAEGHAALIAAIQRSARVNEAGRRRWIGAFSARRPSSPPPAS